MNRTSRPVILFLLVALSGLIGYGCSTSQHIEPYEPKVRDYELPVELDEEGADGAEGSLWAGGAKSNYLYADQRAIRPGDIVTVRVEEFANAERATGTSNERATEMNADIRAFVGLMAKLQELDPDFNPEAVIGAGSETKFNQKGETGRTERLQATVPVMVKKRFANGYLFLEGHRAILVNKEEHHFYVSGVARPIDILDDNSISSTRLADAEFEFTGRGVISNGDEPGFFAKYFGWIWPF